MEDTSVAPYMSASLQKPLTAASNTAGANARLERVRARVRRSKRREGVA